MASRPLAPRLKKPASKGPAKRRTPVVAEMLPVVPHDITITEAVAGQRIDKALTMLLEAEIPALSRARLQALVAQGQVSISGKVLKDASGKARLGDIYSLIIPPPEPALPEAQDIDLDILFEDKDLLVINKPVGMVVHPAPGNRDQTLVNALLAHCGTTLSGIGGVARPGIVHRLDKDTSGLMVVAKNDLAHHNLTEQFADRSLSRTYQAIVWGQPVPLVGSVDMPIGRDAKDRVKMAVTSKGKHALTHYKVLEAFGDIASLVECKLSTGRTHQIRVHLSYLKCPVVGDKAYGLGRNRAGDVAKLLKQFPRQALHAAQLQFIHPRTEKAMKFAAPLPKDMQGLLKMLRRVYSHGQ